MFGVRTDKNHSFVYGEQTIAYRLIRRSTSKNQKLSIKVKPCGEVVVSVPPGAKLSQIYAVIMQRAKWITDALAEFAAKRKYVVEKQYVSGEIMFFLGQRYMLKIIETPHEKSSVKLDGNLLKVGIKKFGENKTAQTKKLLESWYKIQAKQVFNERLTAILPRTKWVAGKPTFNVRTMKRRWGSCSISGKLMFNTHLVKAPKESIDYVVIHELCHIAHHNHSKNFWNLVAQTMPNWKQQHSQLNDMAESYLNW